jgi:hypothetical protein
LKEGDESFQLFVGAFDELCAMDDRSREVSFLALSYPAENPEDLIPQLRPIDLGEAV